MFKAPAGITLNPADFVLDLDSRIPHFPTYALEVSADAAGFSTVWLVRESGSVVAQIASESSGNYNAFAGQKAHWSNNSAPVSGNDYIVVNGFTMRSTSTSTVVDFQGDSLSFADGGNFHVRCGGGRHC